MKKELYLLYENEHLMYEFDGRLKSIQVKAKLYLYQNTLNNSQMRKIITYCLPWFAVIMLSLQTGYTQLLRVGVAGLNHDHVNNIMNQNKNGEVIIIGIAEPDAQLAQKYKTRFHLPDSIFYISVPEMLAHIKPDVVLGYNAISDHLSIVEACAPKGISVMVEKPLATTVKDAERMAALAKQYNIKVLVNYETTWYSTNQQVYEMIHKDNAIGNIRKMVVHDGHQGPVEIGCSPDFLKWLTDPVKNGGGAVMDFGCYGANLMTWLMNNQTPLSVFAVIKHIKPNVYPKVDDDATIMVEYPNATGLIEASWNWPYGIKDMEVFGKTGYLHALNGNTLQQRDTGTYYNVAVKPYMYKDNIPYLAAVLRGEIHPVNDLSSLENNLIVVKILEAAKESARTGKKVML
ncbi:MAG TPA: Gfo/Idh/MocA family oxidoreductase [Chitinophagaceae bacterium]|nr:Gfo/Idh/MocA family oxidoreductase [Chitinophagaceae bacterium]